jgi:hypothetical protein
MTKQVQNEFYQSLLSSQQDVNRQLESQIKTIRLIGEMMKFGMMPASYGLECFKKLIDD